MKYAYFLLVYLLIPKTFLAQQRKLDSTLTVILNKAWDKYEIQSDSALYFADKGIELSRKNGYIDGEIKSLEVKGVYYEEVKNDYKTASELYFKAIEIAEKKQPRLLSTLYNNLCIMYMVTDYEKSEFYGKKAVETSNRVKGTKSEAKAYINLGIAQSRLKKYNEANKTLNFFLTLKVLNQYERNLALLRIAKNYKEQKFYAKAQPIFLKLVAYDSLKGQRDYAQDYTQLIENSIYLKDKNNIQKYLPILQKSIAIERNLAVRKKYLEVMTDLYSFLRQPYQALKYQKELIIVKDSINTKLYKKDIAELETKYQTRKKEEEIDKKQRQILEEQRKIVEEKNKKLLWTFISFFAFLVLLVVVVLLYKNEQKRKLLNANKIELEQLLNQRNMLLRETHHRVKNSFQMVSSLLQLQAQGSKAEAAVTALDSAVERVNSMIVLHQQLYAKDNILGVDLQVYINDLIREIQNSYATENIFFTVDVISAITNIDTATSIGLLVNELATNSIKYAWTDFAKEKIINLKINLKNDEFDFTMFDNGTTKKSNKIKESYGSELIEILIERLDATQLPLPKNDFGLHITFKKNS